MAVNIGPKIGIDGEAEYRRELKNIIQETKTLAAETDQAAAAFKNADDKEKAAADATEKLNKQIDAQKKLVEKLEDAVKRSSEQTGENSTETLRWKEQLAKAKTGLANLEGQTKDATTGVKDLGEAEETTSGKTSTFGDVLKANLAGDAIKKGLEITKKIVQELGELFIDAVKGAAEYADEIQTLSKTTGLGTDELQEYKYMASLLDVDLETITGSMTRMEKAMSTDAKAFEELGVATRDENGNLRDANAVFEETLQALSKIENPVERDTTAMEIFGKSAKELNPLIEASASDLNALRKEAHDVGAVLDKETLDVLNDVNDGFDRVGLTWDALKNKIGAKLGAAILPDLENLLKLFQQFSEDRDAGKLIDGVFDAAQNFANKLPKILDKAEDELPKIGEKLLTKIIKFVTTNVPRALKERLPSAARTIGKLLGTILSNLPEIIKAGNEIAKGLLTGLMQAIPEFGKGFADAFKRSKLTDSAKDAIDQFERVKEKISEIPSAVEGMNSSLGEIAGKQKEAEHWIEIFDELSKKTSPTAEDTQKLQQAVDKLNELFPELGLKIDEETGKWNLNTAEIRDNIDAIASRYKTEAYYAAASDTLVDIAKLELESRHYRDQKTAIGDQIRALQEKQGLLEERSKALERINQGLSDGTKSEKQAAAEMRAIGVEVNEFTDNVGEKLYGAFQETNKEIVDTKGKIEGLKPEYEAVAGTVDAYDAKIKELNDDVAFLYDQASQNEEAYFNKVNHKKYLDTLTNMLSSGVGTVRTKAEAVGIALGQGVEAGLQAESHNVYAKAEAIVKQSILAMKNVAKIASPSKVTENLIGKNLALGIIKGWDDVMNPANLSKAFSMTPVFQAMTASGTTTTNTTTNTTNLGGVSVNVYPASGTNIDALTDLIMIKMQRAVNKRKAVFSNELHVQ